MTVAVGGLNSFEIAFVTKPQFALQQLRKQAPLGKFCIKLGKVL